MLFILTERPQVFYLRIHVYELIEAIGRTVELFNTNRPLFFDPTLVLKLALKKRNTNFCLEHSVRKKGLPFQMFRCSLKLSAGTTQKSNVSFPFQPDYSLTFLKMVSMLAGVVTKQMFWPFYVSAASVSNLTLAQLVFKRCHTRHRKSVSLNILGLLEFISDRLLFEKFTHRNHLMLSLTSMIH